LAIGIKSQYAFIHCLLKLTGAQQYLGWATVWPK